MNYHNKLFPNAAIALAFTIASWGMVAAQDATSYIAKFTDNPNQQVLAGNITQPQTIVRPQCEFHFQQGRITILDFGWNRPSALYFEGDGTFIYTPPNDVERFSLSRFSGDTLLNSSFTNAMIFFTMPIGSIIDTTGFTNQPLTGAVYDNVKSVTGDAFLNLWTYLPSEMLGDLVSSNSGAFLYIDFELEGVGHLVYTEDPRYDNWCRLYQLKRYAGEDTGDILAGYSPDSNLPSQRYLAPIDIYHYDIKSTIESGGDMKVTCRIDFVPLIDGVKYLYFNWYCENKIITALDSDGAPLYPVYKKEGFQLLREKREESGLGLVLNKPLVAGDTDYVMIEFDSEALTKDGTLFYIYGQTNWYPNPLIQDYAAYSLAYDCPDKYEVISCGDKQSEQIDNGRRLAKFELTHQSPYVSFNVGSFQHKEMTADGYPPVEIYLAKEIAELSAEGGDFVGVADRLGIVGADVLNSLAFYTSIMGPCPFDTLKVSGIPFAYGQGSPGVIYLDANVFFDEDMQGYDEMFRAHETAHQWWGHTINYEADRDTWIIEGLAEYCSWWFYEMSVKDRKTLADMLKDFRSYIKGGTGLGSAGTKAGPVVLGSRLSSTLSDDYTPIVYYKGAYIFHMIRYILHDYKTGSDDKFAFFLKDLLVKFKNKPITTEGLRAVLESHTGGDMTWFFNQWVYGTSFPKYLFSYDVEELKNGQFSVTANVKQFYVPDGFKMLVPVTVLFEGDKYVHFKVWVDQPETSIKLPKLPYKPVRIIFNTYDAVLCDVDY